MTTLAYSYCRLLPHIKGNVGFVFTRADLPDVRDKLVENKVRAPARNGAIAPCPVIIPAQNTGLGPEKTSFFQALSIPTKISKGTIEIIVSIVLLKCNLFFINFLVEELFLPKRLGNGEFQQELFIHKIAHLGTALILSQSHCVPPEVMR